MMSAKNSIIGSAERAGGVKDAKLKKQHSLMSSNSNSNSDLGQRKDSSPATGKDKDKDAGDDKSQSSTGQADKYKQFDGEGVVFKTKLVGSELVMEPRGDKMCQNSIQRLKAIIKGQKTHKKRIVMKISYDGVKIYDEKTNEMLYHHEVPQISFISSDDADSRTFGYVCDVPNKAHLFICFKTTGPAIQVMSVISSLFEAVLEKKKKREEQEAGATDNDNSSPSINNNNNSNSTNNSQESDSMLDDQLIKSSITPPPERQGPAKVATNELAGLSKQESLSATDELTKQLGHTLSFSSPMDLIDGSDSGIIDSPSTTFNNDWSVPPPPDSQKLNAQHQQPPVVPIPDRLGMLSSLNSSSPITTGTTRMGTPAVRLANRANDYVLPGGSASHQNRSLIYNHSSVSLNDAALSNRSTFMSPTGNAAAAASNESTDRYAVFNDIDNLPSIFESTSSLGSKTNLSNVGQTSSGPVNIPFGSSSNATGAFDQHFGAPQPVAKSLQSGGMRGGPSFDSPGAGNPGNMLFSAQQMPTSSPTMVGATIGSGDPFQNVDQQYQQQQQYQQYQQIQQNQQQQQQFQQQQYHQQYQQQQPLQQYQQQYLSQQQQQQQQQRPAPTPSMMVPSSPAGSFASMPNSSGGMIVGSAPMGGHQMAAHARFSSSMVAGLHQRLGSSAASIHSVGSSAGGLSRQTNPFDDDFFS